MANDAKLGLVLGVAIVLVIALVFFRADVSAARPPVEPPRQVDTASESAPRARVDMSRR